MQAQTACAVLKGGRRRQLQCCKGSERRASARASRQAPAAGRQGTQGQARESGRWRRGKQGFEGKASSEAQKAFGAWRQVERGGKRGGKRDLL